MLGSGKHREMDALRRRKETGLIRQLELFTARDREKRKGAPRSALIRRDQGRVAVLQDSVDLISRLEDLNAALTSACNSQEERIQAMASQLQLAIHSGTSAATTTAGTATPSAPTEAEPTAQSSSLPHSAGRIRHMCGILTPQAGEEADLCVVESGAVRLEGDQSPDGDDNGPDDGTDGSSPTATSDSSFEYGPGGEYIAVAVCTG